MSPTLTRRTVAVTVITALVVWFAMSAINSFAILSARSYNLTYWIPAGWPNLFRGAPRALVAGLIATAVFAGLLLLLTRAVVRGLHGGGRMALFLAVVAASILAAALARLTLMPLQGRMYGSPEVLLGQLSALVFGGLWLGLIVGLFAAIGALLAYGPGEPTRTTAPSWPARPGEYGYSSYAGEPAPGNHPAQPGIGMDPYGGIGAQTPGEPPPYGHGDEGRTER